MNINTAKFLYSLNTKREFECKCYKINSTIGKSVSDRSTYIISSNTTQSYKYILKNNKTYNDGVPDCCIQSYVRKQKLDSKTTIEAINNTRLDLNWRKEINTQRQIRYHLLHNEKQQNEKIHLYSSCLLNTQQRFNTPRIPIKQYIDEQQKQNIKQLFSGSIATNRNYRSIISKKETRMHDHDATPTSSINNVATRIFAEKNIGNQNVAITADSNINNKKRKTFLCAKKLKLKRWRRHYKHRFRNFNSIRNYVKLVMAFSVFQQQNYKIFHILFVILLTLTQYLSPIKGLLVTKSSYGSVGLNLSPIDFENASDILIYRSNDSSSSNNANNVSSSINNKLTKTSFDLVEHDGLERGDLYLPASKSLIITSSTEGGISGGAYLDKLDNLERSLAAVLIKVAYGTTSTTKRSIPENSYVPSLTTIATPLLTTLRYQEKSHQPQLNIHHRNYELDLERDHALPTSAPNADILKSNSNPTYPNPNRHHNHERDRHRHLINSTPKPS